MKFEFMTANRIIVERGGLKQVGKLAKSFGERVLLVGRLASEDTKKAIEYLNNEGCVVTPVNVKGSPALTRSMKYSVFQGKIFVKLSLRLAVAAFLTVVKPSQL